VTTEVSVKGRSNRIPQLKALKSRQSRIWSIIQSLVILVFLCIGVWSSYLKVTGNIEELRMNEILIKFINSKLPSGFQSWNAFWSNQPSEDSAQRELSYTENSSLHILDKDNASISPVIEAELPSCSPIELELDSVSKPVDFVQTGFEGEQVREGSEFITNTATNEHVVHTVSLSLNSSVEVDGLGKVQSFDTTGTESPTRAHSPASEDVSVQALDTSMEGPAEIHLQTAEATADIDSVLVGVPMSTLQETQIVSGEVQPDSRLLEDWSLKAENDVGSTLNESTSTHNQSSKELWNDYQQKHMGEWVVAKFWMDRLLRYVPPAVRQIAAQFIPLPVLVPQWLLSFKGREHTIFNSVCGLFLIVLIYTGLKTRRRSKSKESSLHTPRKVKTERSKSEDGPIYNLETLGPFFTSLKEKQGIPSECASELRPSEMSPKLTFSNLKAFKSQEDTYSTPPSRFRKSGSGDFSSVDGSMFSAGNGSCNILMSASPNCVKQRSIREPNVLVGKTVDVEGIGRGVVMDMTKKRKFVPRTYKIRFDDGHIEDISLQRNLSRGHVPFQVINDSGGEV